MKGYLNDVFQISSLKPWEYSFNTHVLPDLTDEMNKAMKKKNYENKISFSFKNTNNHVNVYSGFKVIIILKATPNGYYWSFSSVHFSKEDELWKEAKVVN